MADGGTLEIETANVVLNDEDARAYPQDIEPGRYVRLTVRDTGAGMEPQVVDRAFDPFFSTKPKDKGTGLGLATSYGIIKGAGGNILIDSRPGEGTTIEIHLPASDLPASRDAVATTTTPQGNGERVLLVEDEDAVRKMAQRMLASNGYEVIEIETGADAVLVCEDTTQPIDLLLTDVVMPKMQGPDLVKLARQARPDLRVLYISGYIEPFTEAQGEYVDINKLVMKPFNVAELLTAVRKALDADKG
jgi:CheY-like chemotaxis protein